VKIVNRVAVYAALCLFAFSAALPAGVLAQKTTRGNYQEMISAYNKGELGKAFDIGFSFFHGISGAPQDFAKSREWFSKAAAGGNTAAMVKLGDIYSDSYGVKKNLPQAFKWYSLAAEKGDAEGQEKLGDMYYNGEAVKVSKLDAAKWYAKAAEKSSDYSPSSKLGRMYLLGDGIKKDPAGAMKWMLKSDELGDAGAAVDIAGLYSAGAGVKRSYSKAAEWLVKGANQGDTIAMRRLAEAYFAGEGIRKSKVEAYKWLSVVTAKETNPAAETLIKRVAASMSRSEMEEAKMQAPGLVKKFVTREDVEKKAYLKTIKGI